MNNANDVNAQLLDNDHTVIETTNDTYVPMAPAERLKQFAAEVAKFITDENTKIYLRRLSSHDVPLIPEYNYKTRASADAVKKYNAATNNNNIDNSTPAQQAAYIYTIFNDDEADYVRAKMRTDNNFGHKVPVQAMLNLLEKFKNDISEDLKRSPNEQAPFNDMVAQIQTIQDNNEKILQHNNAEHASSQLTCGIVVYSIASVIAALCTSTCLQVPDEFLKEGHPKADPYSGTETFGIEGIALSLAITIGAAFAAYFAFKGVSAWYYGKPLKEDTSLSKYGNSLIPGFCSGIFAGIFSAKYIDGLTKSETNNLGKEYVSAFTDMGVLYVVGMALVAAAVAAGLQYSYNNRAVAAPVRLSTDGNAASSTVNPNRNTIK
jgi:hypothetical protein